LYRRAAVAGGFLGDADSWLVITLYTLYTTRSIDAHQANGKAEKKNMTGGEKLEAIFAGEMVDQVPFALKGWRIPKCEMEQRLLDEVWSFSSNVRRTTTPSNS